MKKVDKIICWDLDKTLTDVSWVTNEILKRVVLNHWINYEDFLAKFRDPKIEWKPIEYRLKKLLWEKWWAICFEEFKKIKEQDEKIPPLFNWIRETLEQTKADFQAVVTNKESSIALPEINWNWIGNYFSKITTSDDTLWDNSKLKPSPFLINYTTKLISGEKLIMIWDTANDVNALLLANHPNKIALLAWWWNSQKTLGEQILLINWKPWVDYQILEHPREVLEYL